MHTRLMPNNGNLPTVMWLRKEKRGRKKGEKGGKGKKEEEDHQVTGRAPAAF